MCLLPSHPICPSVARYQSTYNRYLYIEAIPVNKTAAQPIPKIGKSQSTVLHKRQALLVLLEITACLAHHPIGFTLG